MSGFARGAAQRLVTAQITSQGTPANTNETTLQTFTLPAGFLDQVGKGVEITAWGTVAANGNTKTIKLYFGTAIGSSSPITTSGQAWFFRAEVYRTGANAQTTYCGFHIGTAGAINNQNDTTNNDGSTVEVKVTGQNGTASANDIVCRGMAIKALN